MEKEARLRKFQKALIFIFITFMAFTAARAYVSADFLNALITPRVIKTESGSTLRFDPIQPAQASLRSDKPAAVSHIYVQLAPAPPIATQPAKTEAKSSFISLTLHPAPSGIFSSPSHRSTVKSFSSNSLANTLFSATLITHVALNVADYLSTREALKYPGLQEGNPIMKPFVKNSLTFALVKAGFTTFAHYGMTKLFKKDKKTGLLASIITNLALSYVVANNISLINRAKARM